MSNEERNEYMRNVKWTTARYIFGSTISIVISMAGVYYGLKGDIKDTRTEDREQIQSVSNRLNSKIDSLQNSNILQFQEIRQQLDIKANTVANNIAINPRKSSVGLYIEKRAANGKISFERISR